MKDFNQQELPIAGLERDIDVCQATYRKYAAGMEQAKIDQAREIAADFQHHRGPAGNL